MEMQAKPTFLQRVKNLVIGKARNPYDRSIFTHMSMVAFFAWVGLGADGLSSSAYGPSEAFLALGSHHYLAIFVALASVLTVFVISASYSQIIDLFPSGGGGYLVASKLLSPAAGMVAGCTLLVDYVLTITVSVAAGTDALFSFLPAAWDAFRLPIAVTGVLALTTLNLRGVRETVGPLVPIFLVFVLTHAFVIGYAVVANAMNLPAISGSVAQGLGQSRMELGVAGLLLLVLRAYSMGAGTYTGIEAISNSLPLLREPKVQTGKTTMRYMAWSLSIVVLGLMLAYIFYGVGPQAGKTLNAVLYDSVAAGWPKGLGEGFVLVTLLSEAAILFVAAQTGFFGGPRVLANMALDRWVPTRFAMLSDRLVSQNGILIMGGAAALMMIFTDGSISLLVLIYSINVFATFVLSQLGMVRHWWSARKQKVAWLRGLVVNGLGLALSAGILVSITALRFEQGSWAALLVTGALIVVVLLIRRHYRYTHRMLRRLDSLVKVIRNETEPAAAQAASEPEQGFDPNAKTAVLMVNGFNGLGLHTTLSVIRLFGSTFKNFVFVEIGVLDAGVFKGAEEIGQLEAKVQTDLDRYIAYMRKYGYFAEGVSAIGTDVVTEVSQIAPKILERFPQAIFFGGQLVFPENTWLTRWLHNYTAFALQRSFYYQGIPVVILPIRVV